MNYYELVPNDQTHNNWLLFAELKEPPYLVVKPRYVGYVCPKCKKIDHDKAFVEGFDDGLKIRARGDLLCTSEGFLCVSEKVRQIINLKEFSGITLKAIPRTDWWVVNASCRVQADDSAYTLGKPYCEACGRAREAIGLIRCLSQIERPRGKGTFFSPTFNRCGSMNGDRDLFVSEDIVAEFKLQGVKGGMFARLLTQEEYAQVRAMGAEKNPLKWPKGSRVIL